MTALNRCSVPGSPCRLQQLDQPGPRPGWAALDAAGQRRLTGSLTLHLDPDVHVWFHDGHVLYAERDGDPSIDALLVEVGVVTAEQLARGVVALGPVRHLGRLFDRVPELDQDVVELAVELATAELLGEIADRVADAVTVEPYRLHPSGLHHWAERSHEQPLEAAAQRVRDRAVEAPASTPTSVPTESIDRSFVAPAVPAPPVLVEDDASVAVVATSAPTSPADEPVVDRAVVDGTAYPTSPEPGPAADRQPAVDPHPVVDLRRVIEEVAAEGAPIDEPAEVPDDVRAAVRLALAEIMAATRPSATDGLTVESLVGHEAEPAHAHHTDAHRADAHRIEHEHAVAPDQGGTEDLHGLRRLLGGRHA